MGPYRLLSWFNYKTTVITCADFIKAFILYCVYAGCYSVLVQFLHAVFYLTYLNVFFYQFKFTFKKNKTNTSTTYKTNTEFLGKRFINNS